MLPPAENRSSGGLLQRGQETPDPRMETLNVVVLDGHGLPVTDLTAGDFQITDGGKPRSISYFRVNDRKAYAKRAASINPREFSNGAGLKTPGATVILLDFLNLGFGSRGMAVSSIERQIAQVESPDSLYLYIVTVDGGLLPVRGVPQPSDAAVAGMPAAEPETASQPWTARIKPLLDSAVQAVTRVRDVNIDVFVRTRLTLRVLDNLGAQLAAIPGRKNVIWVTDGVPVELGYRRSDTFEPIDFTPDLRMLSDALDRSYAALYPVRQVMLGSSDQIGALSDGAGATGGAGTGIDSIGTLDLLADFTGGRRSTNKDILEALQQSTRDLAFSYQIGFYAPPENWNDNFHKLRITTKRKGVHIQAKSGYYAWKYEAGSRSTDAFRATAAAANDADEIGLRATVEPALGDPHLSLRIDGQDVWLVPDGDRFTARLRVMTVEYGSDGKVSATEPQSLDIRCTAAERQQILSAGIQTALIIPASPGQVRYRVMVFDRASNGIGSVTIPAAALESRGK